MKKILFLCTGLGIALFFPMSGYSIEQATKEKTTTNIGKAQAIIEAKSGSNVKGVVTFTKVKDGVKVVADIDGLKKGKHGFHIHEKGDCSAADGSSAGGHFNPTGSMHGGPDSEVRHVGDLGNVEADSKGHVHFERIDQRISLDGPYSIIGKSIVIHELEDDFKTQPAGASGNRQGCGVIEAVTSKL